MTRDEVLKEYEYTRVDNDLIALENEPYTTWHTDAMADEIVRLREALKHETQWADAGIDSTAFWQQQRDELAAQLAAVEVERDRLRTRVTWLENEIDMIDKIATAATGLMNAPLDERELYIRKVIDAARTYRDGSLDDDGTEP